MADTLAFKLVDAFTRSPYGGNVAGVVFDADGLDDRQMQAIAAEFNASETTFILKPESRDAALRFRWFTPGCEVGFCGHATLAGVHALLEDGRFAGAFREPGTILPIETRSGILTVRVERGAAGQPATIWLDTPHNEPKAQPVILPPLLHHLGLPGDVVDPALPAIRTHDDDVIVAVRELPVLLAMTPNMGELAAHCRRERLRGVMVTTTRTLSAAVVAQSRFFAPAAGIDEDPVTGSAHGPLGLHLVRSGVVGLMNGRADFHCAQAKAGGRAGLVRVVVTQDNEQTWFVRVGGTCVTTASGMLVALPMRRD